MQLVRTDKGYISGTLIGESGKEVSIFRGIPYAALPVGDLRWKPPWPVVPWEGIREGREFSLTALENPMFGGSPATASGDCL
jgi:para-nitrobenzyl esterase